MFSPLRPYNNHKLLYRSQKCIFLGYCSNYSGYKCYDPVTKRTIISRHVVFDENTFPAKDWISSLPQPSAIEAAPFQVSPTKVYATLNLTHIMTATNHYVSPVSSPTISTHSTPPPSSLINTSPSTSSSIVSPISLHLEPPSPTSVHVPAPPTSPSHPMPISHQAGTSSSSPPSPTALVAPLVPHHPMTTRLQAST
jgi:hypothetical protein